MNTENNSVSNLMFSSVFLAFLVVSLQFSQWTWMLNTEILSFTTKNARKTEENIRLLTALFSAFIKIFCGRKMARKEQFDKKSYNTSYVRQLCTSTLIWNRCLTLRVDHLGPCMVPELVGNGRKWPKIGHLDDLQPQISILGQILLKQQWSQYKMHS